MDLRIRRTHAAIRSAFIELRSRRPLEKITVKELADLACINKATFYQHYKDIYDLSETLEEELTANIIHSIPHPESLIDDPGRATLELFEAYRSQTRLLEIVFSGSRRHILITRLEEQLRAQIFCRHPDYAGNLEKEILITFLIQGAFQAYLQHADRNEMQTISAIAEYVGRFSPDR